MQVWRWTISLFILAQQISKLEIQAWLTHETAVAKLIRGPVSPVGFASDTWNAVDPGVFVDFEVGPTHGTFTVNPGHRFHLVHWMLKAHQPSLTVEHTPCNAPPYILIYSLQKSKF